MAEFDPDAHLMLKFDSKNETRMDRTNSALYTHIGEAAMFDHVFVRFSDSGNVGSYIFRHNPVYKEIITYMAQQQFPMHLNATGVEDCDKDAFEAALAREVGDMPDETPGDWLKSA